jgi:hypothetical protein
MRIAQQAHLTSIQLERRTIDLDVVELGYQAALMGDQPTMEQMVEQIRRLHKNALQVVRALARDEPLPRGIPPSIRDRVLKLLLRAGIVEHVARGRWHVVNPLFVAYIRKLDPLG